MHGPPHDREGVEAERRVCGRASEAKPCAGATTTRVAVKRSGLHSVTKFRQFATGGGHEMVESGEVTLRQWERRIHRVACC